MHPTRSNSCVVFVGLALGATLMRTAPTRALGQARQEAPRLRARGGVLGGASLGTHTLDVGAIAGAGVSAPMGRPRVSLRTRYECGVRRLGPDATGRRRTLAYLASVDWPMR